MPSPVPTYRPNGRFEAFEEFGRTKEKRRLHNGAGAKCAG
jgi:hypothetical protein